MTTAALEIELVEPRLAYEPTTALVTYAEVAECSCPDTCERDHEQD